MTNPWIQVTDYSDRFLGWSTQSDFQTSIPGTLSRFVLVVYFFIFSGLKIWHNLFKLIVIKSVHPNHLKPDKKYRQNQIKKIQKLFKNDLKKTKKRMYFNDSIQVKIFQSLKKNLGNFIKFILNFHFYSFFY